MAGLSTAAKIGAAGKIGSSLAAPRGIVSSSITANAQKSINKNNLNFAREMYDKTSNQYQMHGIPFIPGLTTGGSSPLPLHTQALGNRNVTTGIPGLRPMPGAPMSGVSGAMGLPLLS